MAAVENSYDQLAAPHGHKHVLISTDPYAGYIGTDSIPCIDERYVFTCTGVA